MALGLVLFGCFGLRANAGDELPAAPSDLELSPVRVSTLPWYQVPRRSRVVLRKLAAKDGVTLSKCITHESDGLVRYEFHAWRRTGLFSREDVVLTEFTESVKQAGEREATQSLRGRLSSLSRSISPR
jgi:hypothetical protein